MMRARNEIVWRKMPDRFPLYVIHHLVASAVLESVFLVGFGGIADAGDALGWLQFDRNKLVCL